MNALDCDIPFLPGPVLARSHASGLPVPHLFGAKRKRRGSKDMASRGERPFRRGRAGRPSSRRGLRRDDGVAARGSRPGDAPRHRAQARAVREGAASPAREVASPGSGDLGFRSRARRRLLRAGAQAGDRARGARGDRGREAQSAEPRACEPPHVPRRPRRPGRARAQCFRRARNGGDAPTPQTGAKPGGRARRPPACRSASGTAAGPGGLCASLPVRAPRSARRDSPRGPAHAAWPPSRFPSLAVFGGAR